MATIIVQFNKKKRGKIFTFYNNKEIGDEIHCDQWKLISQSKKKIDDILVEDPYEKIILILHDRGLKKAIIFANENNSKDNFILRTKIDIDKCNQLFKRINIIELVEGEEFVRSHTSAKFDDFYKLLVINEDFGIPERKMEKTRRDVNLRQKDRVIYSDMYKRLVDKAQIYSARKSIYIRNRLSHTNEVASITETLSQLLNKKIKGKASINETLARTIALAHDLGHTPFGHAGERAIEDFLEDKETEFQFFKHNYNGVRVLTYLEESYKDYFGLNLSAAVSAGVIGHTNLSRKQSKSYDKDSLRGKAKKQAFSEYILKYFNYYGDGKEYNKEIFELLFFDKTGLNCAFLEGQIVAIADEIAQKGHDIEDSILAKLATVEDVINILEAYVLQNGEGREIFKNIYEEIKNEYQDSDKSEVKIIAKRINSIIINYLVLDVVETFEKPKSMRRDGEFVKVDKQYIKFSAEAHEFIKVFSSFTKARILNSKEVVSYDKHGDRIIKGLLNAYFDDVRLLPFGELKKINYQLYKKEKEFEIDFVYLNFDDIERIKNILKSQREEGSFEERVAEVVLRAIVDFVSSITDSYAEKLYEEIFKTKVISY